MRSGVMECSLRFSSALYPIVNNGWALRCHFAPRFLVDGAFGCSFVSFWLHMALYPHFSPLVCHYNVSSLAMDRGHCPPRSLQRSTKFMKRECHILGKSAQPLDAACNRVFCNMTWALRAKLSVISNKLVHEAHVSRKEWENTANSWRLVKKKKQFMHITRTLT